MDPLSGASASFEFGRFRILPLRREVLADGRPMQLGGRAFDVLMALVEANGALVTKDELMSRVWPGRVIEENNLHAQIRALRRAFSDSDLIRTVVGRGYQFTGEIRARRTGQSEQTGAAPARDLPGPPRTPTNLPAPTSDLIGRDAEIRAGAMLADVKASDLAAVDRAGNVYRLNPYKLDLAGIEARLIDAATPANPPISSNGCGTTRAGVKRRASCSRQSTTALSRASKPPILRRQGRSSTHGSNVSLARLRSAEWQCSGLKPARSRFRPEHCHSTTLTMLIG